MNLPVRAAGVALAAMAALGGCGDGGPVGLENGATVRITVQGFDALDSRDGALRVWTVTPSGDTLDAGGLNAPGATVSRTVTLAGPARAMLISWEPPGDDDGHPSPWIILEGELDGSGGLLELAMLRGPELNPRPGAHSLFTSSNNVREGYPSHENAGMWLFSLLPRENAHGTREVKLTGLETQWMYEGWAVYRPGTSDETWLSYGKFRPDWGGLLTSRDDTGSGPFSGDSDFVNGGVEDVPGDEWTTDEIASQLGLSLPDNLALPLELDAVDPATGEAVWWHVMTIEPSWDEGEALLSGRPFIMRPYGNPIGAGRPSDPRVIEQREEAPRATVEVLDR